jgi:hypothetical protein
MGTNMNIHDLGWLQPVLIGAVIVFLLDLIGNMISFSNRFLNALTTGLVFAVVFGGLIYSGIVRLDVKTVTGPVTTTVPAPTTAP